MNICFDVDGVIAKGGRPYKDCVPYPGVKDRLQKLKDDNHYIILQTARYMGDLSNNQWAATVWGKAELTEWLDKWEIPYDIVLMGKGSAQVYVDDKGYHLNSESDDVDFRWDHLMQWVKDKKES